MYQYESRSASAKQKEKVPLLIKVPRHEYESPSASTKQKDKVPFLIKVPRRRPLLRAVLRRRPPCARVPVYPCAYVAACEPSVPCPVFPPGPPCAAAPLPCGACDAERGSGQLLMYGPEKLQKNLVFSRFFLDAERGGLELARPALTRQRWRGPGRQCWACYAQRSSRPLCRCAAVSGSNARAPGASFSSAPPLTHPRHPMGQFMRAPPRRLGSVSQPRP